MSVESGDRYHTLTITTYPLMREGEAAPSIVKRQRRSIHLNQVHRWITAELRELTKAGVSWVEDSEKRNVHNLRSYALSVHNSDGIVTHTGAVTFRITAYDGGPGGGIERLSHTYTYKG